MDNKLLKDVAKKAPLGPGVYTWIGARAKIIYVGRASNLRNRLLQYFNKDVDEKVKEIVKNAKKINYFPTSSILESIILEANEIKKHWPIYNIKDRDDRSFVYITISKEDYPKIKLVRANKLKDFSKSDYKIFGPYQSYNLINKALKIIRKIFPYSNCQANSSKACFDYQIGLCPGACIGQINKKDYNNNIKNIATILEGKQDKLIKKLIVNNPDKAKALRHLQDVSLLQEDSSLSKTKYFRIEAYDISHWQGRQAFGAMVVLENNYFKTSDYRLFKIKEAPKSDDLRALDEVIQRRLKHQEWKKPDLILIDGGKPQIDYLTNKVPKDILLVGISKLGGDHLVFTKQCKNTKELRKMFATFQKLRDEAHRFANYGRKRSIKKEGS